MTLFEQFAQWWLRGRQPSPVLWTGHKPRPVDPMFGSETGRMLDDLAKQDAALAMTPVPVNEAETRAQKHPRGAKGRFTGARK